MHSESGRNELNPARAGPGDLLEREDELLRFEDLLSSLQASRGRVVLIEGPAGIGRTSLLRELRDRAEAAGMLVLAARVVDLERDVPGAVIRQLVEHAPQLADAGAVPTDAGLTMPGGELGPEQELLRRLHRRLMDLAAERPVLITVDDVQAADQDSLKFLVHLATRIEWSPIALGLSRRTGDLPSSRLLLEELLSDSQVEELRPRPLSRDAVQLLIHRVLGRTPHPAFTAEILGATRGNPLFAGELLRELRAEAVSPTAEAADVVRATAPRAVARSVLLHVGRLGEAAVAYALAAALLGDDCGHDAVLALANLDPATADAALDALVEAEVLDDADGIRFRHPVVRAAVYQDVPARELAVAHARAAEVLRELGAGTEAVTRHLFHARPRGDPATARMLHDAARRAMARGAPESAARYLRRALDEPAAEAQRPELAHDLADALLRTGDAAAIRAVDRALPVLDEERRTQLTRRAASLLAMRGRRTATVDAQLRESPARGVLEAMVEGRPAPELGDLAIRALGELDLDDLVHLESPAIGICANALICADRDAELVEPLNRAADRALALGSTPACATVFSARARAGLSAGRLAEAHADAAIGIGAAQSAGFALLLPLLGALRALVRLEREGPAAAWRAVHDLHLDDLERRTPFSSRVLEARAAVHLAAGRPREALTDLEGAEAAPAPLSRWRALAAAACLALGDRATALAHAECEFERAQAFGAPREVGAALRVLALSSAPAEAEALLRQAVAVLATSHDRLELAGAHVDLGAHLRRENRRIEARDELHRGQALALQCGAMRLAERASAELAATGARSRTSDPASAERLTASERRVAELAAGGRSNPQIAADLVITRKTVELHLTNVYRKLGIRSRDELVDALEPQPTSHP